MTDSEIREAIERVYGELLRLRNALPPPAPCKPVSAEERAAKIWPRFLEMPLVFGDAARTQVASLVAAEIREAESAAFDRGVVHAAAKVRWESGGVEDSLTLDILKLKGKCHEVTP